MTDRPRLGGTNTGRSLPGRPVVAALVAFHAGTMGLALLPGVPAIVSAPPVVLTLAFVPGTLLLLWTLERPTLDARFVVLSLGVSLLAVTAVGVLLNLGLPVAGVDRPMSRPYLAGATTALVLALGVGAAVRVDDGAVTVPVVETGPLPFLAFALLPLWSVVSVAVLNRTGANEPVLFVLAIVALVPLVASRAFRTGWQAFGIWSMAMAVLYHDSLWQYSWFGGSPGVVTAWEARRWTPGMAEADATSMALLENGVLFPTFARLSGVDVLAQMEVVNPFLVAFIPVAMFVTFRRFVDVRSAFVAAALFVFAHPFYLQYPTAGRAATPVLFFVLFGVVLTDGDLSAVQAASLRLLFAAGVITTHYGTAYYVMAALLGGVALVGGYWAFDSLLERVRDDRPDSVVEAARRSLPETEEYGPSVPFVLYYATAAVGWYMFTVEGAKFALFPRHASRIVSQLVAGSLFTGGSAQRIQRSYGGEAIQLSKGLYVGFAVLMAVGLLVVYYHRFFADADAYFDDEYLAVSSMLFGMFGVTVLFQTWGGGRPMMITFSYTALFAVLGLGWCGRRLRAIATWRTFAVRGWSGVGSVSSVLTSQSTFAVLLAAFFLLNTGVASSVVLDGRAPNNVPLQPEIAGSDNPEVRSKLYRTTDLEAHVWINEYHPGGAGPNRTVYGDSLAHGQTDWYRPAIELRTGRHDAYYEWWKPRGDVLRATDDSTGGYVLVLGHNERMGVVLTPEGAVPFDRVEPALSRRNRIYTTGNSSVYYRGEEPSNDDERGD